MSVEREDRAIIKWEWGRQQSRGWWEVSGINDEG